MVQRKSAKSLRQFYTEKDKILIWHQKGGLGDVLMQRMLFEDFKSYYPNSELIFACLPEYMAAAEDHPAISKVIDSRYVNPNEYKCYNTCVSIANYYENKSICLEHRSDIWAESCGVKLTKHEMCFNIDPELIKQARKTLEKLSIKKAAPIILFAPTSKMATKTLLSWQIELIINKTKDYNVFGIHKTEISELTKLDINGIYNKSIKEWLAYIAAADYVISVDTATFHAAGGLKKPLMGIFTFADGKTYGKYFDFILVQKHRDNGNWSCGPCFKFENCPKCNKMLKPCLTELTEQELTIGLDKLFEKWKINN